MKFLPFVGTAQGCQVGLLDGCPIKCSVAFKNRPPANRSVLVEGLGNGWVRGGCRKGRIAPVPDLSHGLSLYPKDLGQYNKTCSNN